MISFTYVCSHVLSLVHGVKPKFYYFVSRASKATTSDAKCVTVILGKGVGDKKVRGKMYLYVSRENKRIKPIKQSNVLMLAIIN